MRGPAGAELMRLDRVCVDAGGRRILDDISLVLPGGCLTVVGGPSGAGKSTLLRLLDRLDVPGSGSVSLRGVDLGTVDASTLRRDVAMIFQRPPLFPGTVADNLRVADRELSDAAVRDALNNVDLPARCADQPATTLSLGEAQRLCFARALVNGPSVVLADEPTSALDASPQRALEDLGRRLVGSGMSVIWVSHDAAQIRRIADHLVVIDGGRVVAEGSLDELADDPSSVVRSVLGADA